MKSLVVAHHSNYHQYCGVNHVHDPTRFDLFGSASSRSFTGPSFKTFQPGAGLLSTPLKSLPTSLTKNAYSASPQTPSPSFNESKKGSERNVRSSPISIPVKINFENERKFHFSERWAGPAYSSSPPPSSLPLPKFSLPPRKTVSLDLPTLASEIDMCPIAKSAPASPTWGWSSSPRDLFDPPSPRNLLEPSLPSEVSEHCSTGNLFDKVDATKTLRRILNLDTTTK